MSMDTCESHGWWEVNGQEECPNCVITRLRAEVEHLKIIEAAWIALKSELKYTPGGDLWPRAERVVELEHEVLNLKLERDEVRAETERLKGELVGYQESTVLDGQMEREHNEALAQVAVLGKAIRQQLDRGFEGVSTRPSSLSILSSILDTLPVEARALLNRLHALEDRTVGFPCGCVVTLKGNEPPLFTPGGCHTRLQRAEVVMEILKEELRTHDEVAGCYNIIGHNGCWFGRDEVVEALAEWEEGK